MKRGRRKKITYQRSIIVGFAALYITCMLFSTYLVKENYVKSYEDYLGNQLLTYRNAIYNSYYEKFDESGNLNENFIQEIKLAFSSGLKDGDKYNQISAALFGPEGEVIARSQEYFGQTWLVYSDEENAHFYPDAVIVNSPYDYFTEEEIGKLLDYLCQAEKELSRGDGLITSYEHYLTYNQMTGEPVRIEVSTNQCKVEQITGETGLVYESYELIGEATVIFEWTNPHIENVEELIRDGSKTNGISGSLKNAYSFPYLSAGKKYYEAWKENEFLQTFDSNQLSYDGEKYNPSYKQEGNHIYTVHNITLNNDSRVTTKGNALVEETFSSQYALQIKQTSYPWHAAFDYMKYVYLYGFLLMVVCMIKTIHTTKKAYEKQEELEQARRDFTNAAAHELKTPLAIVRNILENMEREKSEEKNTYYRNEAIHQTEVMDHLIQEMIFISKMDGDKIKVSLEPLSMKSILKDQLNRLEPMIEEKNLLLQIWDEEDYILQGDRSTIEKAVFNLLENAVSHNRQDGKIAIHVTKDGCSIENTADSIPKEELDYVFDMFFTGDKSRHTGNQHKGLGLYLAKRIFEMHNVSLNIENTEIGVKVVFAANCDCK